MPVVIPTVPIAENTSNITSESDRSVIARIVNNAKIARNIFRVKTVLAFLMASSSNLLLNTAVLCLSVIPDHRLTTSIKIVVVLIHPAVEPGEPPININTQVSNFDAEVRLPVSTLLKPAVLAVVAEKSDASIRSPTFIPFMVLLYSVI